jgi:hypothetical protein
MKTWVRKTLSVGVLAAGALLFAPAAAQADSVQANAGDNNAQTGTRFVTVANVPVSPATESAPILGAGDARGAGKIVEHGGDDRQGRRGQGPKSFQLHGDSYGWLTGNQVYLPVTIPLNVAGNSILTAGRTDSRGVAVNSVEESGEQRGDGGDDPQVVQIGGDSHGWLSGNQLYAPIDIPINACGNSILAIGPVSSTGFCANGISNEESGSVRNTELYAPTTMPELLSGSAARTRSVAGNRPESGPADVAQVNGRSGGLGSGNQIALPIKAPINACGNSIGILFGAAQSTGVCSNVIRDVDGRGNGDDDRDCDRDRDCFGDDNDWDHNCDRDRGCFGDRDRDHGCDHRHRGTLSDALFFQHHRGCKGHDGGRGIKGDHGSKGGHHGNKDDDDKYAAANGVSPDTNKGYGQGEAPDNYAKPAAAGSNSKATGGRQAADLTESVNGLGLLNTLR